MEVRDPVHGSIYIQDSEIPIIEHPYFQRLRSIKQLGFSEYVFPGATHTRYLHSIGVMEVSNRTFNRLFHDKLYDKEFLKLKETLRLGCLLHDIGHAPLSHTTEMAMPQVEELKLPKPFDFKNEQASHEHYTLKTIVDSSLTDAFKSVKDQFGVETLAIAELIHGETTIPEYFTVGGVNYFPILHQLVSSEIDCDRMDYLLRDSYFCGVSYGHYDLDWLIDNFKICEINGEASLGITERAISTFDDFLISRFHMFMMVYFHYKAVCLEKMLYNYFNEENEYSIPADIEKYREHDDHHLTKVLRGSNNRWAKMVIANQIPEKIFESFGLEQLDKLNKIEECLKKNNVEYIKCSSLGRLSKYYSESDTPKEPHKYPIRVARKYPGNNMKKYPSIDEATNLYDKYSESHAVNRLHCEFNSLDKPLRDEITQLIQNY
jgi:HD superfamily phosphohydrolase